MKATAQRNSVTTFTHRIDIRQHELKADEPHDHGGDDEGPSPQELLAASLASCTAVTIEMYAKRKGWEIGPVEVQCEYTPAERGCPTNFKLNIRLSKSCTEEQIERLRVIAAKCPVHRTLDGEVVFDERIELVDGAAGGASRDGQHTPPVTAARKLADGAERLISGGAFRRRG
jgi:putative redox protein